MKTAEERFRCPNCKKVWDKPTSHYCIGDLGCYTHFEHIKWESMSGDKEEFYDHGNIPYERKSSPSSDHSGEVEEAAEDWAEKNHLPYINLSRKEKQEYIKSHDKSFQELYELSKRMFHFRCFMGCREKGK